MHASRSSRWLQLRPLGTSNGTVGRGIAAPRRPFKHNSTSDWMKGGMLEKQCYPQPFEESTESREELKSKLAGVFMYPSGDSEKEGEMTLWYSRVIPSTQTERLYLKCLVPRRSRGCRSVLEFGVHVGVRLGVGQRSRRWHFDESNGIGQRWQHDVRVDEELETKVGHGDGSVEALADVPEASGDPRDGGHVALEPSIDQLVPGLSGSRLGGWIAIVPALGQHPGECQSLGHQASVSQGEGLTRAELKPALLLSP